MIDFNGFEKRKQEKKQNIIKCALTLFKKNGIKKTSITAIAKEANVSKVTIFKYFTNKEQLVHEVITEHSLQVPKILTKYLQSDLPFPQKLKQLYLEIIKTYFDADPSFIKSLTEDFYDHNNPLAKIYYQQSYPNLVKLIDLGRQEGYIREDISNQAILVYIDYSYKTAINSADENLVKYQWEIKKMFLYSIVKDSKVHEFLSNLKDQNDF